MVCLELSLLLLFCFNGQLNRICGKGSPKKCSHVFIYYAYRYTYLGKSLTPGPKAVLLKLECAF